MPALLGEARPELLHRKGPVPVHVQALEHLRHVLIGHVPRVVVLGFEALHEQADGGEGDVGVEIVQELRERDLPVVVDVTIGEHLVEEGLDLGLRVPLVAVGDLGNPRVETLLVQGHELQGQTCVLLEKLGELRVLNDVVVDDAVDAVEQVPHRPVLVPRDDVGVHVEPALGRQLRLLGVNYRARAVGGDDASVAAQHAVQGRCSPAPTLGVKADVHRPHRGVHP
mmetsp:Transcript_86662/g.150883  ORF Transcript_86662/g.150883 Transcript_86662/m.150883 type:complete len:225 (-) Transcript_86662:806-1480(-)